MVSIVQFCIKNKVVKPIREIKYNNLRRYFYKRSEECAITYKEFAAHLSERADVMGKMLSGQYEIPDDKIIKWCGITGLSFSFFYEEHFEVQWPPEKKSYRMMPPVDRLILAAEDYVEYSPKARKSEKMNITLQLVCEEMIRVVPEDVLLASPILMHFVECFGPSKAPQEMLQG